MILLYLVEYALLKIHLLFKMRDTALDGLLLPFETLRKLLCGESLAKSFKFADFQLVHKKAIICDENLSKNYMSLLDFKTQFVKYGEFHSNPINQFIHVIFVPMIMWSGQVWVRFYIK